jgi:hypothetical protein
MGQTIDHFQRFTFCANFSKGTRPPHDLQESRPKRNKWREYELVTIALADFPNDLQFTLNHLTRTVEHFHYETFAVPSDPIDVLEKLKISFELTPQTTKNRACPSLAVFVCLFELRLVLRDIETPGSDTRQYALVTG